jgi:hypothetical protein
MKQTLPGKPITQMMTKELSQATKEFKREFAADSFGPPDPMAREQWRRAKRKRGRPRRGCGVKVVSISVKGKRPLGIVIPQRAGNLPLT